MGCTVTPVAWDSPDARTLREAQQAEIQGRYGGSFEPGVLPSAADMDLFVLASDEAGRAVGCGGLRRLDAHIGEIKRMYVVPDQRGTGAAAQILTALERAARALGWTHLRLETGDLLAGAIAFYTRAGYRPIPKFGPYAQSPISLCFEREL